MRDTGSIRGELSESAFEILRAAVDYARLTQCSRLVKLRIELRRLYPGKEVEIEQALQFWGRNASCRA